MAYVVPLRYMSWLFVGLFTVAAPILLFFTARFSHESMQDEFTWGKSQIFVLSSLTMRGWKVTPNNYSCRCAFMVTIVAGAVIYYHWEAMLISYLSTRFTVLPFTNIRELVETSDYRIALMRGTYQDTYFKTTTDVFIQRAYSERIEPFMDEFEPFYPNLKDLLLTDDSLAVFESYEVVSQSAEYQTCKIIAIPAKYGLGHGAIALQKNSPFNDLFNFYLKEMREKGSLQQILRKYEMETQFCPDDSGKPLGLESCFTAFLALLSGMGIALLMFFFENFNEYVYKFTLLSHSMLTMLKPSNQRDVHNIE